MSMCGSYGHAHAEHVHDHVRFPLLTDDIFKLGIYEFLDSGVVGVR